MRYWKLFTLWLRKTFKMNLSIEKNIDGLIDESKVKNVCLHYDGEKYYFTAIVNDSFVYITHSPNFEIWFKNSNIPISRFCDIWEMEIPKDVIMNEPEYLPFTIKKAKIIR